MKKLLCRVSVGLFLLAFITILPARPADAVSPLVNWSANIGDTATYTSLLLGQADAGASVGWCNAQAPTTYALQTFSAGSSTPTQQVPSGTFQPYVCDDLRDTAVVDKDGVVYARTLDAQSEEYVGVLTNNQVSAAIQLPENCPTCVHSPKVHAMTIGSDGDIYTLLRRQNDSGGGYTYSLTKFDSDQHTFNTPVILFSTGYANADLAPYQNGLVIRYASTFQYYSYAGAPQGSPIEINGLWWDEDVPPVTPSGRVIVGKSINATPDANCSLSFKVSTFEVYEPSGHVSTMNIDGCYNIRTLRIAADDTVVALLRKPDTTQDVVRYKTNGDKWTKLLVSHVNGRGYIDTPENIRTDRNGSITIWRPYVENGYRHVQVDVLSSSTGNRIETIDTKDINSQSSFSYITRSLALTDNHLYLTLFECSGATSWCTSNPKLYSFNLSGATLEYPKSEIIAADNRPQLKLAVLGDSYSAGEGVEPFFPSTDRPPEDPYYNTCHRSELSYSRLLDRDPLLPIKEVGSFACSGATSADLLNTWQFPSTQPPQITSLQLVDQPDIIALTIGGNDAGFGDFAKHCILDPDAYCNGSYQDTIHKIQQDLPDKLDDVYGEIDEHSGEDTKILILGYPQLVPIETYPLCTYLSETERLMARDVVEELNEVIAEAAGRAGEKFHFVDAASSNSPFWGHQLCTADSYFIPPTLPAVYSLHPNKNGQQAYKELIVQELENLNIIP